MTSPTYRIASSAIDRSLTRAVLELLLTSGIPLLAISSVKPPRSGGGQQGAIVRQAFAVVRARGLVWQQWGLYRGRPDPRFAQWYAA